MSELLIVDGYNVIFSLEAYRNARESGIQTAVDNLILELLNVAVVSGLEVVVVFDGAGKGEKRLMGPLTVVYSAQGESADSVIERLVFSEDGKRRISVCTSDQEQQKVVQRGTVRRMTPNELSAMVKTAVTARREYGQTRTETVRLEDRLPEEVRRRLDKMRRNA